MSTITIKSTYHIGEFRNLPGLNKGLMAKMDMAIETLVSFLISLVESITKTKKEAIETFVNIMMKISIIKLAITMMLLIFMTVLFFLHLHAFDPVTLQFSKWVTSPLVGFIMLIVALKFVGISIGITLTILAVKKTTLNDVLLRLKDSYKQRLCLSPFLRRKAQPQIS